MLKVTYTNGDAQVVKVTGDFFTVTLAEKNGEKKKLSPVEKAEDFAIDAANYRGQDVLVSKIELFYPNNPSPKVKMFRPEDEREVVEKLKPTKGYIRELKKMKREWKHKKWTNRWYWSF